MICKSSKQEISRANLINKTKSSDITHKDEKRSRNIPKISPFSISPPKFVDLHKERNLP